MKFTSIEAILLHDEDLKLKPYRDSRGKLTIGVGRNLDDIGITEEEALHLLDNDIKRVRAEAIQNFSWFLTLSNARQIVLQSMIFNLGLSGVKNFKGMLAAIEKNDFEEAADEMLLSLWVLFDCTIQVSRHSSKKNEKIARRNAKTNKLFIGKSSKALHCEQWLLHKLMIERLKQRIDKIECDINAEFVFYFPKSVYYTKEGVRSRKLPDLSNLYELPQDCLQQTLIILNDTQIVSHNGSRRESSEASFYSLRIILSKIS